MGKKTKSLDLSAAVMRTAAVLLILVLGSTCMVSGRYARYVATSGIEDAASVAKFSVTEAADFLQTRIAVDILPGQQSEQKILVENNSEVAVRYSILAENPYENLPLEFEIKKGAAVLSGMEGYLKPGEKAEFILVTKWNANQNDIRYSGRVDLIEITLRATQVD